MATCLLLKFTMFRMLLRHVLVISKPRTNGRMLEIYSMVHSTSNSSMYLRSYENRRNKKQKKPPSAVGSVVVFGSEL